MQEMVGGHVIVTFNSIDVELTRNEAEQLKVLLAEVLENITRDPLPRGQQKCSSYGVNCRRW